GRTVLNRSSGKVLLSSSKRSASSSGFSGTDFLAFGGTGFSAGGAAAAVPTKATATSRKVWKGKVWGIVIGTSPTCLKVVFYAAAPVLGHGLSLPLRFQFSTAAAAAIEE